MNKFNPDIDFSKPLIGMDYETFPIGMGKNLTNPQPVVLSIYDEDGNNVLFHRKSPTYTAAIEYLLQPGHIIAGQNLAYDLVCLYNDEPKYITAIFDKYEAGEIYDTKLAEQLMNLGSIGIISDGYVKDKYLQFRYDLGKLASDWLGVDMTEDKAKATEDELLMSEGMSKVDHPNFAKWDTFGAWRTRYHHLWNFTDTDIWPKGAREYALNDSKYVVQIAQKQIDVAVGRYEKPFRTLAFQCMKAFAFALRTTIGVHTDPVEVQKIKEWVDSELTAEKLEPLLTEGIVIPACLGREYKRSPGKFTKPTKESMSKEPLQRYIVDLIKDGKVSPNELKFTDTGMKDTKFLEDCGACTSLDALHTLLIGGRMKDKQVKGIVKQVKVNYLSYIKIDKHFQKAITDLEIKDPIIDNFIHYKKYSGLKSNEVPRMSNPILYPTYDPLKLTGRCSSKGNDLFPSSNIQQVNGTIRKAYTAREGYLMLSTDYSSMELITAAQICFNLFGYSVLLEKIKLGYDVHAYLGSQLAVRKDDDFGNHCEELGILTDTDKVYDEFFSMKGSDFFKKYRSLAKPVGLGFWGGLGAKTFIQTAKTIYGVIIESEEEAKDLKRIWNEVFPESKAYFPYIVKHYEDYPLTFNKWDEKENKLKTQKKYRYISPYGMVRRNCDYTKVMNGFALQTPGGEGAMSSMYDITRESFDPSLESPLFGNYLPYGFIHDEELGDVKVGHEYKVAVRIDELMRGGFEFVCPDVPIKTEAALMTHWSKKAESIINHETKTISLWKEEEKKA
jgi:hypothetical protein